VLLGEECITVPKWQSTKRKQSCDVELVVSSTNYDIIVGLYPGLHVMKTMKIWRKRRNWWRWVVGSTAMTSSSIGTRVRSIDLTRNIKSG
jgi:hypothetical protein